METKPVIPPTTGRRVLLFIAGTAGVQNPSAPFDAGIAFVHNDTLINVGYCDHGGNAAAATSVKMLDRAQTTSDRHGTGETYAVWMEFQFQQALTAQAKAAGNTGGDAVLVKTHDNDVPVGNPGTSGSGAAASDEPTGGKPALDGEPAQQV